MKQKRSNTLTSRIKLFKLANRKNHTFSHTRGPPGPLLRTHAFPALGCLCVFRYRGLSVGARAQ